MRHLLTLVLGFLVISTTIATEKKLIEFSIKDQFGEEYTQNSFDAAYILVLGADREGSQYTDQWGPTLADSLKKDGRIDSVVFVALANLQGVPGMMKGMIKGFFPKEKENWVLLDWDGEFDQAYGFVENKCNILLFDQGRNLVMHEAVTDYMAETAERILNAIKFE
jgi:hypothetical protein